MSDLPTGWVEGKIGDLFELTYGKSLPEKTRSGKGFPVYGSNGIVGYHNKPLTKGETIVVGRKGSVGQINYSPIPCFPIDTTYYVEHFHGLPARFWFHSLKFSNLGSLNKATAIPGINRNDIYDVDVFIPPLNQQNRIAEKLDSLLANLESCHNRLERASQIIKQFRRSVLGVATSGNLTNDWRDARGIAEDWKSCSLGDVITDIRYGTSKKSVYKLKNSKPVLRIPNIVDGKISRSDLKFTHFEKKEIKALSLKAGDLLLIRSNGSLELVGKVAIVDKEFEGFLYAGYLIRLRFDETRINPRYISYYLSSPAIRNYIEMTARSTSGVNNINSEEVKSIPLVLPSLEEQTEILQRVDQLFVFADSLEFRCKSAIKRVEQLPLALLAKAFRGELVEQNPDIESAEKLLQRVIEIRKLEEERKKAVPRKKKEKKMRTKNQRKSLYETILQLGVRITPEDLFERAGFDESSIDEFYEELRAEIKKKRIEEIRRGSEKVYLKRVSK